MYIIQAGSPSGPWQTEVIKTCKTRDRTKVEQNVRFTFMYIIQNYSMRFFQIKKEQK